MVRNVAEDRAGRESAKQLNANVDFYSATTYYALGIPVDLFTPVFAVSRISGWTAHVLEQYANNRTHPPARRVHRAGYPQTYACSIDRLFSGPATIPAPTRGSEAL